MDPPKLSLLLLLMFASTVDAQNFPHAVCATTGNFIADGAYQTTLTNLLSSISTANSLPLTYGFFNASATVSGVSQTVSVIGSCRGDLTAESCRTCLNAAAFDVRRLCPLQKGAVLFNENCTVRYSNNSIFGVVTTDPDYPLRNENNVTNPETYNAALRPLLEDLRGKAAAGGSLRKYASGSASAGFNTIYAMVQCTPDLTEQQCVDCLVTVVARLQQCCVGTIRGRVMAPSCQFRFAKNYRFFDPVGEPLPSPPQPPLVADAQQPPPPPPGSISKLLRIVVAVATSAVLLVMFIVSMCCFVRKVSSVKKEVKMAESLQFTLSEIKAATDSFSEGNKIGEGAFGKVYRGTLKNGQNIAVKRLERYSDQGEQHFKNEVTLMGRLRHNNLIKLLGYCLEDGERLLILELAPNGILQGFISDSNKRKLLSWERRFNIIRGIAQGLLYLHEDSRLRIIHRDLKPSNVLLDENMNPKITDFGMARLFRLDESRANAAQIEGTSGYMAPEYVGRGEISVKTDVYSFSVVVLEIISGKANSHFSSSGNSEHLLDYAWKNWIRKTSFHLIDPTLNGSLRIELLRCIQIALLCGQENVASRLTMDSVVLMIESQSMTLPMPTPPTYLTDASARERSASSVHSCLSHWSTKAEDGSSPLMILLPEDQS